jgi:ribosomal protein L11 methyltransferase
MTSWQLRFITDCAAADRLADRLDECGALSITLEAASDEPLFDQGPAQPTDDGRLWESIRLTALLPNGAEPAQVLELLAALLAPEPLPPHEVIPLEEQDWTTAWREWCVPIRFGQGLWIHPSWTEPPDPAGVNIVLDPGMAFGTGTHPTTALCLEWLANQPSLAGTTVIDYGCGSGILALAAAKLGAERVFAVDVDELALRVTRENAQKNGVSDQIITLLPEHMSTGGADVLMANILLRPLMELAPRFTDLVVPGGRVVLSGVLERQAQECLAAYAPGFAMSEPKYSEGWALLQGIRR